MRGPAVPLEVLGPQARTEATGHPDLREAQAPVAPMALLGPVALLAAPELMVATAHRVLQGLVE